MNVRKPITGASQAAILLASSLTKAFRATAVTIVLPDRTFIVPRHEFKKHAPGEVSLIPEGLHDALENGEVRGLITCFRSPVQVPLPAGAPTRIERWLSTGARWRPRRRTRWRGAGWAK
jgi:hypothetical protein